MKGVIGLVVGLKIQGQIFKIANISLSDDGGEGDGASGLFEGFQAVKDDGVMCFVVESHSVMNFIIVGLQGKDIAINGLDVFKALWQGDPIGSDLDEKSPFFCEAGVLEDIVRPIKRLTPSDDDVVDVFLFEVLQEGLGLFKGHGGKILLCHAKVAKHVAVGVEEDDGNGN